MAQLYDGWYRDAGLITQASADEADAALRAMEKMARNIDEADVVRFVGCSLAVPVGDRFVMVWPEAIMDEMDFLYYQDVYYWYHGRPYTGEVGYLR